MISPLAVVQSDQIGNDVSIAEFVVVRAGAKIGNSVVIHPHVVIGDGVSVGDGVEIFPGAVIGKEPKGAGATARQPHFERSVVIGANCSIGPHAVIYYDVEIGANTLIGDGASIREQGRIGERCLIGRYVTFNYNARVGDRVKIIDLTHITGNMVVGNDVFISTGVFTVNDNNIGAQGYDESHIVGPTIEDGAMIGAGAVLLPAVTIGAGSIVGANAVASKDVAPHTLVMGVPARVIRNLDTPAPPKGFRSVPSGVQDKQNH